MKPRRNPRLSSRRLIRIERQTSFLFVGRGEAAPRALDAVDSRNLSKLHNNAGGIFAGGILMVFLSTFLPALQRRAFVQLS